MLELVPGGMKSASGLSTINSSRFETGDGEN